MRNVGCNLENKNKAAFYFVFRSVCTTFAQGKSKAEAVMVELVDTRDLKSLGQ